MQQNPSYLHKMELVGQYGQGVGVGHLSQEIMWLLSTQKRVTITINLVEHKASWEITGHSVKAHSCGDTASLCNQYFGSISSSVDPVQDVKGCWTKCCKGWVRKILVQVISENSTSLGGCLKRRRVCSGFTFNIIPLISEKFYHTKEVSYR